MQESTLYKIFMDAPVVTIKEITQNICRGMGNIRSL